MFMRWSFGHVVSSWEEFKNTFDAELVTRYWEGRFAPAPGIRQPSRESPTAADSRRRAVAAVMDAFVELGHLEADHEAVLASKERRSLGVPPDSDDPQAIAQAVARWHPRGWSKAELRLLPEILPTVRTWVLTAKPSSVGSARGFMSAIAEHTMFIYRRDGTLASEHVFHAENVNYRTQNILKGLDQSTIRSIRSRLLRVGRAVAPAVIPTQLASLGSTEVQSIYSEAEEDAFRQAAGLDWSTNPAARMFLVAVTLGDC